MKENCVIRFKDGSYYHGGDPPRFGGLEGAYRLSELAAYHKIKFKGWWSASVEVVS